MAVEVNRHRCEASAIGPCVSLCVQGPDGVLWIDDGEYHYAVRFCPICGFRGEWHFGPFRNFNIEGGAMKAPWARSSFRPRICSDGR